MKNDSKKDKALLALEWPLGIAGLTELLALVILGAYIAEENHTYAAIMIITGVISFIIIACVMLKLEQITGYYKCKSCGHKHVPTYGTVLWAPHIGRTRYLRCPKCNKKSWQKKIIK
jgi:DNA-directed RNA polymerase subunit RPC12/RpoP